MACEQCGSGRKGPLPGMGCPDCGARPLPSAGPDGSWIARETLLGRVSTLSRPRKALLIAGVAVTLGCLVGVGLLLSEVLGGAKENGAAFEEDFNGGGAPTRIAPSSMPVPSESPSPSPSPSPSRRATPTPTVGPTYAKLPARTKKPTPPPTKSAPPSKDPGYTGWAGPGCTTNLYQEYGRYQGGYGGYGGYGSSQPDQAGYGGGWYDVPSGGYRSPTCDGRFTAVPMSGHPYQDSHGTAIWSWRIGEGYEKCSLAVYVPNSGRDGDVAGNPTTYRVLATTPANGYYEQATFWVHQTNHRGSLVAVGSYPVDGESFTVQLLDRGQAGWGAHHAAAQMKLSCTT